MGWPTEFPCFHSSKTNRPRASLDTTSEHRTHRYFKMMLVFKTNRMGLVPGPGSESKTIKNIGSVLWNLNFSKNKLSKLSDNGKSANSNKTCGHVESISRVSDPSFPGWRTGSVVLLFSLNRVSTLVLWTGNCPCSFTKAFVLVQKWVKTEIV